MDIAILQIASLSQAVNLEMPKMPNHSIWMKMRFENLDKSIRFGN